MEKCNHENEVYFTADGDPFCQKCGAAVALDEDKSIVLECKHENFTYFTAGCALSCTTCGLLVPISAKLDRKIQKRINEVDKIERERNIDTILPGRDQNG